MSKPDSARAGKISADVDISDDDLYEAMKGITGYLDITPGDLKQLYRLAYRHAVDRVTRGVKARDIMTREVFSVKRDTPLKEVARMMAEKGVAGVPVVEAGGKVAGVISEKDFLSRMGVKGAKTFMAVVAECLEGKGCVAVPIKSGKAGDIMSSPAVTVNEETTVMEIADIFKERNINRVPVVDGNGALIGLVSRADIISAPRLP